MPMTEDDAIPFAHALVMLAETLDGAMSEARIRGYFQSLRDLDLQPVLGAMVYAMKHMTFVPKPNELRDLVVGAPDGEADLAWARVMSAIRKVGRYGNPRPVLGEAAFAAMEACFGSWDAACDMSTDGAERTGCAKQFKSVFCTLAKRASMDREIFGYLPEEAKREIEAALKTFPLAPVQ